MLKSLVIRVFLRKESHALKMRLKEASLALKRIEELCVEIPAHAPKEAHALASQVLQTVVNSADVIRIKGPDFIHEWEARIYQAHAKVSKTYDSIDTLSVATRLIDQSRVFFGK